MKYLTTLEVAHELKVSKQTLLNWLYAGKIPEPPRNNKGYRLWSEARVGLVKRLIQEGRLNKRTVVHSVPQNRPEVVASLAREVNQFLRDGEIDPEAFLRELARLDPRVRHPQMKASAKALRPRKAEHPARRRSRNA
jgi:DNA-binding transcriptional MerR regulator